MVRDGNYICGEHSRMHTIAESLGCTPGTNVTLCVDYTKKKKKHISKH